MTKPLRAAEEAARETRERDRIEEMLRKRVVQAHKDETLLKGGTLAALGYKQAKKLALDCFEMGRQFERAALAEVKGE